MEKKKIVTNARGIDPEVNLEDIKIEGSLRPQSLDTYIGQKKIKESLKIYIEAARQRETSHDLPAGPFHGLPLRPVPVRHGRSRRRGFLQPVHVPARY